MFAKTLHIKVSQCICMQHVYCVDNFYKLAVVPLSFKFIDELKWHHSLFSYLKAETTVPSVVDLIQISATPFDFATIFFG